MNHKVDGTTPKTDAELLFKELGFVLDADQYRDVLSMIDLFHFYIRQREYRPFRATQALIEENKQKALWQFAIQAIKTEVHEKNRKWSWAYFAERRDDRKNYVQLFKAKSRNDITFDVSCVSSRIASGTDAATIQDTSYLKELEKKLGYKDIRFYRSIARSELRKERAAARQEEEEHKPAASGGGWLGWVWGAPAVASHAQEEVPSGLSEGQRKELYQAIDWDEREAVAAAVDLPKDAMMLRVKAKLETGSFALRNGQNQDLVSLNFDHFQLDLTQRLDNFDAELALGGLRVFDGTCEGSIHPQIVRVKDSIRKSPSALSIIDHEAEADEDLDVTLAPPKDPFFSLKFEHNPLDGRADNAIAIRLRHMEVIYNRGYVEKIFRFFKPPEAQLESVGALIDVASSTLEGIRKETRAGLEYALAQHKTLDVQLDLNAVRFVLRHSISFPDDSFTADHHHSGEHDAQGLSAHRTGRRSHLRRKQSRRQIGHERSQGESEAGIRRRGLPASRVAHVRQVLRQAGVCSGDSLRFVAISPR